MAACPNKNTKEWEALTERFGERRAYAIFMKNGDKIPEDMQELSKVLEKERPELKEEAEYISKVNDAIRGQLKNMGVGIGVLEEAQAKIAPGMFDPKATKRNAENLIEMIKVAQGHRGEKAIPEEYAHLVLASLRTNRDSDFQRLYNFTKSNIDRLAPEVMGTDYDNYQKVYQDESISKEEADRKMVMETMGKLVAKHILNPEPPKPWYRPIVDVIKRGFEAIFRHGKPNELQKSLYDADEKFGKFASALMKGQMESKIDLSDIHTQDRLYKLSTSINSKEELLKDIRDRMRKVLLLREQQKLNPEEKEKLDEYKTKIGSIDTLHNQARYEEGVISFMQQAVSDIKDVIRDMPSLDIDEHTPQSSLATTGRYLNSLKTIVTAYEPEAKGIENYMESDEYKGQQLFDFSKDIEELNKMLGKIKVQYERASLPVVENFILNTATVHDFIGKKIGNTVYTREVLKNLFLEAKEDTPFWDRWLKSQGESNDLLLRMIREPVKLAQDAKKKQMIAVRHDILKAQQDFIKAGYKPEDTKFVYEKVDGKYTGRFISKIQDTAFNDAKEELEDRLNSQWQRGSDAWRRGWYDWMNNNAIRDPENPMRWIADPVKWTNPEYNRLSTAQKKFLDFMVETKKNLDTLLPEHYIDELLTPQMRKDWLDRLKASKDPKEAIKMLKEGIGDAWLAREADDEFGNRLGFENLEGRELQTLPIYYTKKVKDMDSLSTDITTNMIMYADMAHNYAQMNQIIDLMEITRDLMAKRFIPESRGGRSVQETFNALGEVVQSKIGKRRETSNFMAKLDDYYTMNLYGEYKKEEGNFFNTQISLAKAADNLMKGASWNVYAVNALAMGAGTTIGAIQMRIDAFAHEYFNNKNMAAADAWYVKGLMGSLGEVGQLIKHNKFDLMMELYDVQQDSTAINHDLKANKGLLGRLFKANTIFLITNCGYHWLNARTWGALADSIELKDRAGNKVKLYDAYEVVDQNGIPKLQLKSGLTKLDGTEWTDKDEAALRFKTAALNRKFQGIYNREDKAAIQRYALGRMAMMFRNWVIPSLNRRYSGQNYSFDMGDSEEGYWHSTGNFMLQLAKDIKDGQVVWNNSWKTMTPQQRANFYRAMSETGIFAASLLGYALLKNQWGEDDEWWKSYARYLVRRLQTEIGSTSPTPMALKYIQDLAKSPSAGSTYLEDVFRATQVWQAFGKNNVIKTGAYKGWNKEAAALFKAAPLPLATIKRSFNPKKAEQFLNLMQY